MVKQKHLESSYDRGEHLLNALTQQELAQLIDALFAVLSPELQAAAIAQLSEDTQQSNLWKAMKQMRLT